MKFTIKEVKPKIFLFECDNSYDLAMTFLRYQETYESPNPKFRNKPFTIIDFMEWYSKTQGLKNHGVEGFSYPLDWAGFNFPSFIIDKLLNDIGITDRNKYDDFILESYNMIKNKYYYDDNFYIIGATAGNEKTIKHEIAHGFFYTNPEYKKEMKKLVKALPADKIEKFNTHLASVGYTKQVFVDEIQAYLSTGVSNSMKQEMNGLTKPFIDTFNKYNKN